MRDDDVVGLVGEVPTAHGRRWAVWTPDGLVAMHRSRDVALRHAADAGVPDARPAGRGATAPAHPDWARLPGGFRGRVLRACHAIPSGQVATYGDLARAAGSPGAARAVGSAMGANPLAPVIPCHRVVRSDGTLGQYTSGGASVKARMLRAEGVRIRNGRIV